MVEIRYCLKAREWEAAHLFNLLTYFLNLFSSLINFIIVFNNIDLSDSNSMLTGK